MKELTPVDAFTRELAHHEKQFKSVLPAHIPPAKFMRTVIGAVQNNPDILTCDRQSVMASCQRAAQDGLVLDGREAALVRFKNQAQYMPMVNGILKKLRNSGQLSTITAQVVRADDYFEYNPATDDVPNHRPDWFNERGPMIGVYAVAKMKDGGVVVEIMNLKEIDKVRSISRTSGKGPWVEWPEEMAKKSVLRRIAKMLPSSADIDQVLEHDNDNYDLDRSQNPEPEVRQTRAAAVVVGEAVDTVDTHTGEVIEHAGPNQDLDEERKEGDPI